MKKVIFISCIMISHFMAQAQSEKRIEIISGEKWYGGAVNEGDKMPFQEGYAINLNGDTKGNQASPLILSTNGRYVWSNAPFAFSINDHEIVLTEFHKFDQLITFAMKIYLCWNPVFNGDFI